MKSYLLVRFLLVLAGFLCVQNAVTAATLQAKVIEVDSGNSLVVTNINRPLRVRLKAVAPPDARQPFSQAALDHLKALVLNKTVVVEYTHLSDGFLEARVFLNGVDVGSQLLRDGVAWYDRSLEYTLSAADREVYARCEQLAREEKRGLWQDPSAVAPWEFRKSKQVTPVQAEPSFNSVRAARTARSTSRQKSFSNTDLLGGMVGPGSIAGNPSFKQIWPNSDPNDWRTFQSAAPRFSIRLPSDSFQFDYPILDGQKKIVSINYVIGGNDDAVYSLMWTAGSNDNTTDITAADSAIQGFLSGLNSYFISKSWTFRAEASPGKFIKIGNYSGKQYDIKAGQLTGVARILSRQIGDQRQMFALATLGPGTDWSSAEFLNSLKIAEN